MKIRVKYQVLCILGFLIFISLPIILNTSPTSLIYAADSTPSADIQTQLKQLEAEIASKAAKIKEQINNKLQNKIFVGVAQSISSTSITLTTPDGNKSVSVNQDTDYESDYPKIRSTSVNSPKDLKTQMKLVALGDVDDMGVLAARRVVVETPDDQVSPKQILWGQVISVVKNSASIKDKDGKSWPVALDKIEDNPKPNDIVIVTGTLDKTQTLVAQFLFVVPKDLKTASSSASPSATPSGSPKPSSSGKK